MRFIAKAADPPPVMRAFLDANLETKVNLDYRNAPLEKSELLRELVVAQGGLCAYTQVAIDERLALRQVADSKGSPRYLPHNEHMKPQSLCRQELVDRGLEPGREIGEDMDHMNIVAALAVRGAKKGSREIFGATARPPNTLLPVLPTQPDCESRFRYLADGNVEGLDPDAKTAISMLKLDHETLVGWRSSAWDAFLDLYLIANPDQAIRLRRTLSEYEDGQLLEFGFVVSSILTQLENAG